ncbi:MAG: hypothetical protein ABJF88_18255 [Rhodothermales bacterium]
MKALLVVLALLLATPAWAQSGPPAEGPKYDLSTVETLRGTVRSVAMHPDRRGTGYGVHLVVDADGEAVPVHLGPSWYLEGQDEQIDAGDAVVIVGSRVTLDREPIVIAREVQRGDAVLVLRDDAGHPAWRGWRRGATGPRGRR